MYMCSNKITMSTLPPSHLAPHAQRIPPAVLSASVGQAMKTPSVTPALRDSLASRQTSAALGVTAVGTLILLSPGHVTTPQGCVSAASTTPRGMSENSVHLDFLGTPLHKTAHVSKTYVSICFDFTSEFCFQLASLPDRLPLLYI